MINPVNSNKTVNTTTDRTATPGTRDSSGSSGRDASPVRGTETVDEPRSAPEIENARQLYQMEQTRNGAGVSLASPAEARATLDNLLQQFTGNPAGAASAQLANVTSPMANLLKLMPA
ncbi:MAG: hypothetical protein ABW076_07460 [Candidatus Thiodiazotropha sp.]